MDYLKRRTELPVPEVYYSGPDALVHEYIAADGTLSVDCEPEAADHLAKLHAITSDSYGFDFDTLRGGVRQPNAKSAKWVPFFTQNRLLYMARLAYESGNLPPETYARIEKFAENTEKYLDEPPRPALLHGDISTTTILCRGGRVRSFVDPAVFFGDPEFEFAYAGEQPSLSRIFYDRYGERHVFRSGFFEYRQSIYNLYPLLLNVKTRGGGALPRVDAVLKRFGF